MQASAVNWLWMNRMRLSSVPIFRRKSSQYWIWTERCRVSCFQFPSQIHLSGGWRIWINKRKKKRERKKERNKKKQQQKQNKKATKRVDICGERRRERESPFTYETIDTKQLECGSRGRSYERWKHFYIERGWAQQVQKKASLLNLLPGVG